MFVASYKFDDVSKFDVRVTDANGNSRVVAMWGRDEQEAMKVFESLYGPVDPQPEVCWSRDVPDIAFADLTRN